jgi:AcrR family transcriptional regulator
MSQVPASRRERLRAATFAEIVDTARRVLVDRGPEGLALRAVARELGMSAPSLYRYYSSREDLIAHVIAGLYDELATLLRQARATAADDDPLAQLLVVARSFRTWALQHRREFTLLFGSPIRGPAATATKSTPARDARRSGDPTYPAGQRFAAVFAESFVNLYLQKPFPVPADDEIDPRLRQQLLEWHKRLPLPVPIGGLQIFLTGWLRIYGMVTMEAFGHLEFALKDGEAMYEHELQTLANILRPR